MKFHNQKSFMGHEISNVTNKPLLHKKGKQWIVVAVSALILAGFGGMVSTTTHADTIQPAATTKVAQPSQNNGNSSKVVPTSNPTKNNPSVTPSNNKPVVHMLGGSNPVATPSLHPDDKINHDGLSQKATGNWGTATWNLYTNGQLDIHDGNMYSVNNFNHSGYNYNQDAGNSTHRNSSNYDLNPNDVISIKTYGVTAPENASGLFSGDNGGNQNSGGSYNHFNNVKSIDLSGLDTSNTTDMSSMFHDDSKLTTIKFGNFQTGKVTDMEAMFDDDASLDSLDLNQFDTHNCNNFSMMFYNTPGLRVLDISKFVIGPYKDSNGTPSNNGNANVQNMFDIGCYNGRGSSKLEELAIGPNFKPRQDPGLGLINSGDTSSLMNTATSATLSNTGNNNWNQIINGSNVNKGAWIKSNTSAQQNYTVTFYDDLTGSKVSPTQQVTGVSNAPFLPLDGINLPQGYVIAPNNGNTVPVNNKYHTATVNIYNVKNVENNGTAYGTWGNANWILYKGANNKDKLLLINGQLGNNNIETDATNNLSGLVNDVYSISTKNVVAPNDATSLFKSFIYANPIDLTGMDFSSVPASNISNMLPNKNVEVDFNNTINGDLYENMANNSSMANTANTQAQSNANWINTNSASLSSASTSASDAASWVNSYGSNASNAGSWYSANSGKLTSMINSASTAYLNASNAISSLSSEDTRISANSTSASSFSNELSNLNINGLQNQINQINNTIGSSNKTSGLSVLANDYNTLNTAINKANGIASQAANANNWVNANGSNVSNEATSASTSANTNATNINTNSANASNSAYNAQTTAEANAENYTNAYINSLSASTNSGISNDNTSATASASVANANADSYALSLANNATNTANENAGGIDGTMNSNYNVVQSLSNTVNANTASLADNENNLYQTKENKPVKKHIKKQSLFYFYVIKPIWLHTNAKFTKGNRVKALPAKHGYTVAINRIFKVNGALRFEIRLHGENYFVTGLKNFVQNAYIQPKEINKHSSVKLLGAVREYKKAGFGKKNFIRYFKKGSVLPVKRVKTVAGKEFTRLQLTNGHWITANKNLVKLI